MWTISRAGTWIPLYVVLVGLIIYRHYQLGGASRAIWMRIGMTLLAFAVAVGLADYVSSGLIKPWFCRLRPTHDPSIAPLLHIVRGYRGGLYGFVSSHAANTMAVATLFTLVWRNLVARQTNSINRACSIGVPVLLFIWCAANCYSRMYLGVHYPGDILGGLLVGFISALLTYTLLVLFRVAGADREQPACS